MLSEKEKNEQRSVFCKRQATKKLFINITKNVFTPPTTSPAHPTLMIWFFSFFSSILLNSSSCCYVFMVVHRSYYYYFFFSYTYIFLISFLIRIKRIIFQLFFSVLKTIKLGCLNDVRTSNLKTKNDIFCRFCVEFVKGRLFL